MAEYNLTEWTSLLSSLTALVAVFAGPIVTWNISKRHIIATAISSNRQKWIEDIRGNIAQLITNSKIATVEDSLASSEQTAFAADANAHNEAMKAITLLQNKILLSIDPRDKDHIELSRHISRMIDFCSYGNSSDKTEYYNIENNIIASSQQILTREWTRVIKGT